jgi:hypothetical protein
MHAKNMSALLPFGTKSQFLPISDIFATPETGSAAEPEATFLTGDPPARSPSPAAPDWECAAKAPRLRLRARQNRQAHRARRQSCRCPREIAAARPHAENRGGGPPPNPAYAQSRNHRDDYDALAGAIRKAGCDPPDPPCQLRAASAICSHVALKILSFLASFCQTCLDV